MKMKHLMLSTLSKHIRHVFETYQWFPYLDIDIYQPYDDHAIEDLSVYCVEVHAKNQAEAILFPTIHSRCFGARIKFARFHKITITIHHFRRPYHIEDVNYKKPTNELFSNEKLAASTKRYCR